MVESTVDAMVAWKVSFVVETMVHYLASQMVESTAGCWD